MNKLVVKDLAEARRLDQSTMEGTVGGKDNSQHYIFSAETLAILGKSDATVAARQAEEDALDNLNDAWGR